MTPGAGTSICRAVLASAAASRSHRTAVALIALAVAGCHFGRQEPAHAERPAGAWHVMAPGETLEALAKQADVPMVDLLEINGLGDAVDARPGRLIFVLASPIQRAPAPAADGATPAAALPS